MIELTEYQFNEHLATIYAALHIDFIVNPGKWDADKRLTLQGLKEGKVRRIPNISHFRQVARQAFLDAGNDCQTSDLLVKAFVRTPNNQPRTRHATYF